MVDYTKYRELAKELTKRGYKVKERREIFRPYIDLPEYRYWEVNGRGIVAVYCEENSAGYPCTSNKIAADNAKCFDKWSCCPMYMNIDGINLETLFAAFKFLGTQEGYEFSNSYAFYDNNPLPYEK